MVLPVILVFLAIASALANGQSILGMAGLLLMLAAIRELLAAYDYRRVLRELHTTEEQERQTNALVRQQKAAAEESNQRLRAYMMQVEDLAVEQERVRFAREIHDGLGHHLNNIKVHSEVAHRSFATRPDTALGALTEVKDEIRNAQRELRRAIEALVSDDYLASPLEELLSAPIQDCQLAGVAVDFQVIGVPRPLPEQVKHGLYRIGQEALSNIRKHAHAKQAALTVDYQEQYIRIAIEDDGIGMPAIERRRGRGLDNLQERAVLIGGTTTIETCPGNGVRIVVEVPS
jgi:signal transduction histidine kinase